MNDYTFEVVEPGLVLLTYRSPVTREVFRNATEAQVDYVAEHVDGDYVLVVDFTQTVTHASAMDIRLNSWAVKLHPNMIGIVLISQNVLVNTAANLVQRVTHKMNIEIYRTPEEALDRARAILAEHARQRSS